MFAAIGNAAILRRVIDRALACLALALHACLAGALLQAEHPGASVRRAEVLRHGHAIRRCHDCFQFVK